jgi:hypothetical protein
MRIEKADSDNYKFTLSSYELELLKQIILLGIDKLRNDQYELLNSIHNDKDNEKLKTSISLFHIQTEQETAANIMVDTLNQIVQKL